VSTIKESSYGYSKVVPMGYEEAIKHVTEEMKKEGFGVLTQADITATLKKRIGVDFKPYTILGACNPKYAYLSLQLEEEIGLMLPCNFIVYVNNDGETVVSAINPIASMQAVDNQALGETALEVQRKIRNVVENL
jgi:uncharacterized protein (DUF302 family)